MWQSDKRQHRNVKKVSRANNLFLFCQILLPSNISPVPGLDTSYGLNPFFVTSNSWVITWGERCPRLVGETISHQLKSVTLIGYTSSHP